MDSGYVSVEVGAGIAAALRTDGSIATWGSDFDGFQSNAPTGSGFTQISLGSSHGTALRQDGSIVAWGNDQNEQASGAPTGTGFQVVHGGSNSCIAIGEPQVGNAFCFGDGSGPACPCNNTGTPGEGCLNSTGVGAVLSASGHAGIGSDTITMRMTGVPFATLGLMLRGDNQVALPIADGILCTAGATMRPQIEGGQSGGVMTFTHFKNGGFGSVEAPIGSPTFYQGWYRDQQESCSSMRSNFSNAWEIYWLP